MSQKHRLGRRQFILTSARVGATSLGFLAQAARRQKRFRKLPGEWVACHDAGSTIPAARCRC